MPLFGQDAKPPTAESADSDLKIVVLEGEDGVNIVKKKTAVKPVVEVRDKNNLPVSGATVVYALPHTGASATFAHGARTLTMLTNGAGRAAVASMKPIGTGAFKISVTASLPGHVAATATIAQTNFITAAAVGAAGGTGGAAAGASGGAAAGAAGGAAAGAGLSTAAIAGIVGTVATVAGVAGGIVAAKSGKKHGTIAIGTGPVFGAPH